MILQISMIGVTVNMLGSFCFRIDKDHIGLSSKHIFGCDTVLLLNTCLSMHNLPPKYILPKHYYFYMYLSTYPKHVGL